MRREEVKQKLKTVCDTCVHWFDCEKSLELYESGCEDFELNTCVECNVPCEECYLYELALCKGVESKYIVTIDL